MTHTPHDHVYLSATHDANTRRTLWVLGLTAVTMVGEIVAGYLTGSMALLADGFHMATHAGALTVAALAYLYARKHAHDRRYSFGTGKVGDLAGFASALVLGMVSLGIAFESILRLFQPQAVAFTEATIVAVIGLIINLLSALLLGHGHNHGHGHGHGHSHSHIHHHGHDHGHHHHHEHAHASADNNLRAAYVHVLADALTSILAIVALLAGRFAGWWWLDPLIGVVGAVVIARWAWSLVKGTSGVLLDRSDAQIEAEIRECVETDGTTLSDLHVWRIGPAAWAAIVSTQGPADSATIRSRLTPVREIQHLTVETQA
ncbi:CDF family Co(II)/Ni(II) efflux transporter DmeF [Asticcacaulis excentricus]|uniref:Cation diffusion facilitator family transporter n=1 Tax=Asticcacaulis excentricus (strain ATCC 15261 / DSM 4724 / KCTC 12464 / NCIMB 9791 / VKM B-1370 / CB 48) TaxID=573065 RepID=E8RRM0_ASTEC|nr:CDF family Co(II)/Ni(II) efflux transporter DmeF [Asticcacaulis excentricus]ADU13465.1 cation diffusion facilitator family transporter [Asticcacaulis excentricus CB 48]